VASSSLLLDRTTWDLTLDVNGNWATCWAPYAVAQDAACEMKLFEGEAWYDVSRGVPYWQQILGKWPPITLVKHYLQQAALRAPGAVSATVFITNWTNRNLGGQVQIRDANSRTVVTTF
jgi:hypothetical protein